MGVSDYDGRTALHLAAAEGHLECVKFLLQKCDVPPDPADRSVSLGNVTSVQSWALSALLNFFNNKK